MKPWLFSGTAIWHETLVLFSPGTGSVLPGAEEHQPRYHMLSVSTDLPKKCLTSHSHRNRWVQPRRALYIAMDWSSFNGPRSREEAPHLPCAFLLPPPANFPISLSPPLQKGFSPGKRRYLSAQSAQR